MDSKGRWIVLDMLVDKASYMLVNIYAQNTDDVTFFQDIHLRVQPVGNIQIVIGRDFNLVLDNKRDSINRVNNNNNSASFVYEWLEEESLSDVYQTMNLEKKHFTSFRHKLKLIASCIKGYVRKCEYS